ncbi:hypothetical protein Tco_1198955 [Tanacetum coccineum]
MALGRIYCRGIHRLLVLDFESLPAVMAEELTSRMLMEHRDEPEKVIVTDLFYLSGMDVGLINIHYLLAGYLRMFALGRKRGAMISRGQFVAPPGLERQPDAAAGSFEVAEDAHVVDKRIARLEEDVHGIRGALGEQREAGVRYTSYADFQISYVRCTRHRTNEASTSTPQQPDL